MPISILPVLAEAWALFRRDRDWLLGVAGPFLFLPAFALALLVPPIPDTPRVGAADAGSLERVARLGEWLGAYGGWYAAGYAVGAFGAAALFAAYLDGEARDVREALRRAGTVLPRYLLASVLVAIPTGAGLYLWVIPGLYVMGRTMLAGPALVAERPLGAMRSLLRSLQMSAGAGLPLMALSATVLLAGILLAQPFVALESQGGGRIVAAVAAAGIAAVSTATSLAQVLVAVAAYRRLAAR